MKTTVSHGVFALMLATAVAASAATFTVSPTSPGVFDSNNTVGVPGDPAPGFPISSIASNGVAKTDAYFTPESLFGRSVTVGEVAQISYWTKTGTTHTASPYDWALTIYTKPYAGDVSSASWYGDRYGAEPYFSSNLSDPANTWNLWSTNGTSNQLRFFESTAGAPGASFGTYTDPNWSTFKTQTALSGQPRASEQILFFSWQTGSDWAAGFKGQIDGVTITLTDGSVAKINFEADVVDADGDGIPDEFDHCPNSDTRPKVDVNGTEAGQTTIANTVDDEGCTIQDLVNALAAKAKNHGQYVSGVTNLANQLKAAGTITNAQKTEMTTGAAKSKSGK
ncbi:MAG: hypothetical protein JWO08_90 [Verrucomicrobiaceae bacterium]|nr:hypothetical protein [Verrucomicrobiaceae bacterium]